MKPLIGITCNVMRPDPTRPIYRGKELHYVEASLSRAVIRAGGSPALLAIPDEETDVGSLVADFDGLVLSSGLDLDPKIYGRKPAEEFANWLETEERDQFEIELVERFRALGRPVLGICRGVQVINVSLGGTLHVDVSSGTLRHRDGETYDRNRHSIEVTGGTLLADIVGPGEHEVVSVHHQAIDRLGTELRVTARSADGLVEALESTGDAFLLGVQWHPEWMPGERAGHGLLEALVTEALAARDGRGKAPALAVRTPMS